MSVDSLSVIEVAAELWDEGVIDIDAVGVEEIPVFLDAGFHRSSLRLAVAAFGISKREQPITLRGLFYRLVSAGLLADTGNKNYDKAKRTVAKLRKKRVIPYKWIVDNLRSTMKPPSWSGICDFAEVAQKSYRLDFWERLPEYVHILSEKDAIAATLASVTTDYDVRLSPLRGYASLSFLHQIGDLWSRIEKPIHVYYLGDYDPSGFDIERSAREGLGKFSGKSFEWTRLAVNASDFERYGLLELPVKQNDTRAQCFLREHGDAGAEVDAIPSSALRSTLRAAIESHIDQEKWARLKADEAAQKASFNGFLRKFVNAGGVES